MAHGWTGVGRWLRRVAMALCALLLACLCLALCLPWLAEQALARALSRRDLGNITLGVQAISWHQATLGPLAVCGGDGVVQAQAIVVRYRPSRLRHYQVDAVEVIGLRLPLVRHGTTWVPAAQETLQRALDEGLRLLPEGSAPTAYPRLDLRSSQFELRTVTETVTVPFEATVRLAGAGPSRLQAVAWVCGDPVAVDAAVDLGPLTGTLTVDCRRLDLGAWLQAAAWVGLPVPDALAAADGTAALRAEVGLNGAALDSLAVDAAVSALEVPGEPLPLRLREAVIALRSGPDLRRAVVTFSASSESLAYGVRMVEPFQCSGSWQDGSLEATAEDVRFHLGSLAHGTARLRLTALGLMTPDNAWLDCAVDLNQLCVATVGPLAGSLHAVGTLREVWVNGVLAADPPGDASGLSALTLDARIGRGDTTEIEAAATLEVRPEVAAGKLGAGVHLSGTVVPLELTAALELPADGPWQGTGTIGLPPQRVAVTTAGLQADATLGLECRLAADASGVSLAGRLHAAALTAEIAGATLAADAVTVTLDAWRRPWPAPNAAQTAAGRAALAGIEVEARAFLRDGRLRLPQGLECEGIHLDLPLAWSTRGGLREHPAAAAAECLRTGPIRFGKLAAAGFRSRCTAAGQTLRLDGELQGTAPAVTVRLTQTIDWANGLSLAVHYEMPPLRVQGDEDWYPEIPGLRGLRLAGTLAVDGDLRLRGQRWRAPCRLRLSEGELSWPQQQLTVSGLDLDLRLLDLLQLRTAPFQTLRFAAAKIQGVPVDGGQIVFALDGPDSLSLLRCELNWCGGQVHTQAVHLNPRDPQFDLVLFADNVDIIRALNLVKGFTAKGSGVLNGKLPISYRNGLFSYAKGYLYNVPGQPGHLELRSAGWLTAALPKDHPAYAELQQAEKALEDFRLDIFRLEFTGRHAGAPGAKIQLVGEGVNGKVPVTLNLNVNGPIEEALNLGLRFGGM